MKHTTKVFMITLFVLLGLRASAQTSDKPWNLGVFGGIGLYSGDMGNGMVHFDRKAYTNNLLGGLSVSRYLNSSLDVAVTGSYGLGNHLSEFPKQFCSIQSYPLLSRTNGNRESYPSIQIE